MVIGGYMKINCLNGNIIVKVTEEKVTTKAGLIVNTTEQRGKRTIITGEIIYSNRKDSLQKGSIVYFPMFAAQPISLDGLDYAAVNAKDVILVKENE
jgi:co-chaperonin GroES (HSP10)